MEAIASRAEKLRRAYSEDDNTRDCKRLKPENSSSYVWKIQAILDTKYYEGVSPRKAIAFSVKEKKSISSIVTNLDKIFPLEEKDRFIKRVRIKGANEIFILVYILSVEADSSTATDFRIKNKEKLEMLGREVNDCDIFITHVPSSAPRTRSQFENAKILWPCHFHEDKILESIFQRTKTDIWGLKFIEQHARYMQASIDSCSQQENAATVVNSKR